MYLSGQEIIFFCNKFGKVLKHNIIVSNFLAPVVQMLDSAIHRINHYPADSVIGFPNTYPLDSDLSGG